MKTKILFLISIFVIGGLFLASSILAQETETSSNTETTGEIEEVAADEDITAQDLGVGEPRVLPDSPFYFVKNFLRGVRTTFTFNPVRKAELRLRFANEKLIEAKKLAEKTGKDEILEKTLEKYQKDIEKIKARVEKFKEKAKDNPRLARFLDKFIDRSFKQQRLMDRLEKRLADKPEVLERIRKAKERSLQHFGKVIEKLEEKDKIPERLEKNLEKIKGSKYKHFKNLEVLMELEKKVPEEAKEAIRRAQENSLKRLHEKLENMSSEDQEKFKEYLENIGGDQTEHLKIIEKLREKKPTPVLKRKLEQNREEIRERLQNIEEDRTQLRKGACIALWAPVCGKDGKTYSNACFAKLAGVEIAHKGECEVKKLKLEKARERACRDLWWFDRTHRYCQQKKFCGAFMYLGLRTFATEEECRKALLEAGK